MKINYYHKGQSLIGIIVVLVIVGLISGGLYYYLSKKIPEVPEITKKPAGEEIARPEEITPSEEVVPPEEKPAEEITPPEKITPPEEVKPEEPKEPVSIQRAEYIVVVKENSIFKNQAERFSNYKKAGLLTYNQKFSEISNTLRNRKPIYLVLFATPEELTPDFIDNVDLSLRELDSDPYLDIAYGIITSRNKEELKKYVDRLINYSSSKELSIYGISLPYPYRNLETYYNIPVKTNCLTNCVGGYCVCNDENRATSERIKNNLENSNIFIIYAHGSPSTISLDNGEAIKGSLEGLYGYKPQTTEKIDLTHITILTIANSCLTGRINGKPKIMDSRFDTGVEGEINTSIVLSFLQSGSLNLILPSYVAMVSGGLGGVEPKETIIEEAILQNVPIGIALKDLKNRYIMVLEKYKVPLEGSPVMTDKFTRDTVANGVKGWILFGDPSIVLSAKSYQPINCIQEYSEQQSGNKKIAQVKVKFSKEIMGKETIISNSLYIDKVTEEIPQKVFGVLGVQGGDICIVKTEYEGIFKEFKFTSSSGLQDEYYLRAIFIQDLGDEIFLQIPYYIAAGGIGGAISLNYEIISE